MTFWYLRSKRKPSGGLLNRSSKKRRMQRGRDYVPTHLDKDTKLRPIRTRGGNAKLLALKISHANVSMKGKIQKVKITNVIENPADPHLVRRNIITKGAVIQTEVGKARVTSRPGQDGIVNAILIEEKK